MITTTSLTHPKMLAKIRLAMRYAVMGQGEKMNGHANRCYIENRKGHNIMRVTWYAASKSFVIWAGCTKDAGSQDITEKVKQAFVYNSKKG